MRVLVLSILLLFACMNPVYAQVYEDRIYHSNIHSLLLYNERSEQSFPLIALNSEEKLLLSFDDFSLLTQTYYYTIEHCTHDWQASNLSQVQYINGFFENPITEYRFSFNTIQNYTHYELSFPNSDMKILLSGNYILKVFLPGESDQPAFTRRFMIYDSKVGVRTSMDRSSVINDRFKKQKINLNVFHPDLNITNPFDELKVYVMQNTRWNTAKLNTRPTFIRKNELVYDHVDANIFDGGNEFRKFDIRSTRFMSERMAKLIADTVNRVYLLEDISRNNNRYVTEIDMNGNFFIRRTEGTKPEVEGDYVHVLFSLDYGAHNPYGDFYVVGKFNDWRKTEVNKMTYNLASRNYELELYLKQGIYDYQYVFIAKDARLEDVGMIEGNFYDTENDYQVLVYHRRVGNQYDELVGYFIME